MAMLILGFMLILNLYLYNLGIDCRFRDIDLPEPIASPPIFKEALGMRHGTFLSVGSLALLLFAIAHVPTAAAESTNPESKVSEPWPAGRTYNLQGMRVTISSPVVVARRTEQFWYPNLVRFSDGNLAIIIRIGDDFLTTDDALVCWSKDGGLTWGPPKSINQSYGHVALPSGEVALLPYNLYTAPNGFKAPMTVITSKGEVTRKELDVTGMPRPDGFLDSDLDPAGNGADDVAQAKKLGRAGFYFDGQSVKDKDGKFLTTLYGKFKGAKRYSTLVAESADGFKWRIRSVVADEKCKLPGNEGPNEACLCRLPDGRLMCVFRMDASKPFSQSWSADEGATWSKPIAMKVGNVEPRLLTLESDAVVLAGGRPGLYLWFNHDRTGKDWQAVDTLAHHNALLPQEPISTNYPQANQNAGGTSAYTGMIPLDEKSFLYVYDRVPNSFRVRTQWKANSKDANNPREAFSIYIVKVTVERD